MSYIDQLKTEIQAVREARQDLLANGQTVSIQGSHSYTKVRLAELNAEEARLTRLLAAALGCATRKSEVPRYE